MNDVRIARRSILGIGGLTALLCAIIVMLIPLTIWVFYTFERQARAEASQDGGLTGAGSGKGGNGFSGGSRLNSPGS
jgi:hypothetical protein